MNKTLKKYEETIAYVFWGFLTTVVSWLSYSVSVYIFNLLKMTPEIFVITLANIISWVFAVLFAFFVNKYFVFKSKEKNVGKTLLEFAKFVLSRLLTGLFELVSVPLLVKIGLDFKLFGVDGMVSKIIVTVIVIILNYIISKFYIFKRK